MRALHFDNGHWCELAGSILELRAAAWNDFNYWLLRESGIGTGPQAVEQHFAQVTARISAASTDPAELPVAADALALLHYCYADTLDGLNCQQLAFGCLVATVDGRPVGDRSEEGLRRLLHQLSDWGLTQGLVAEQVDSLKKACAAELRAHFPAQYPAGDSTEAFYHQQLQARLLGLADYGLSGELRHLVAVHAVDAWLLEQSRPDIFDDGDERNVLVVHRQRFGERCAALSELGYPGARDFTVFDYNSAVAWLLAKQQKRSAHQSE